MLAELKSSTNLTPVRLAMRASVIIVSYNGCDQLQGCLRSLQDDLHEGYEVIVVDNASQDGSVEMLRRDFPHITLIANPTNAGFGGGNNSGASYAQGRYLAFLNPDTRIEPGWLEALISALEADPTAGLATSKILLLDDPGRINTCGNEVHISGLTLCRGMGMPSSAYHQVEEVGAVSGAAFAIRRELFERIGGFDPSFFLYMEDTDLSLRARLAGFRCLFVPGSVVYHDYRLTFGPKKTYYQERNRYRLLLKSLRWPTLLAMLPALLLAEAVTWGFVLLREPGRMGNKLISYGSILKDWPSILEERRKTQLTRTNPDRSILNMTGYRLGFEQTGGAWVARLAHWVFDPLFYLSAGLARRVVRW
jgi:GT2 family glycosyltransferase